MTRFRFRGHRGATDAINKLRQQAREDAIKAREKDRAEKEAKKEVKEDQEVNEIFPPAVSGQLKAVHDKLQKLKKAEKEEKDKKKEVKEDRIPISLPTTYGGDHSVRNIYVEATYRGPGGRQMQVSRGREAHGGIGGLYGSVADSPIRSSASPTRPKPAAAPVHRQVAKPVAPVAKAAAPVAKPTAVAPVAKAAPPVAKPTSGFSNVPAKSVPTGPKFSAPNVAAPGAPGAGGSKSSSSELFRQSSSTPQGGIKPGQAKSSSYDPGVKRPEIKAQAPTVAGFKGVGGGAANQPVSSYKPAAQAVQTLKTAPGPTAAAISAPVSSTLPGVKSLPHAVSPIAKPAIVGPTVTSTVKSDLGPSSAARPAGAPSIAKPSAPPSIAKPSGPITDYARQVQSGAAKTDTGPSSSLSATSPELKSIMAKDAGPGQSSLTPGLKVTPTPLAAQRQTIRKKVQDIAGPLVQSEDKISLPDKYGGEYSIRRIYKESNADKS